MPAQPLLPVSDLTQAAHRLFQRELERHLAPLGLAPAHMPVLAALRPGAALTQKALAAMARVEQPTMAATLNRMERDGLIARSANPGDGRSMLVQLTPLARQKLVALDHVTTAINALALEQLSPAERDQLVALLGRVVEVLRVQDEA